MPTFQNFANNQSDQSPYLPYFYSLLLHSTIRNDLLAAGHLQPGLHPMSGPMDPMTVPGKDVYGRKPDPTRTVLDGPCISSPFHRISWLVRHNGKAPDIWCGTCYKHRKMLGLATVHAEVEYCVARWRKMSGPCPPRICLKSHMPSAIRLKSSTPTF